MKNKEKEVANNFKSTPGFKNAIRKAAIFSGQNDMSKFIRDVLSKNKFVKKYLEEGKS